MVEGQNQLCDLNTHVVAMYTPTPPTHLINVVKILRELVSLASGLLLETKNESSK